MPSVEYSENTLIAEIETREYEDPETGEIVTRDIAHPKIPFEVRISKWLERDGDYQLHGFVETTDFGLALISQSDPWTWVNNSFSVADELTELMVSEMVDGVAAVENDQLYAILEFGNITPIDATVESEKGDRIDFRVILDGAGTYNVDWLTVSFDPNRGDV